MITRLKRRVHRACVFLTDSLGNLFDAEFDGAGLEIQFHHIADLHIIGRAGNLAVDCRLARVADLVSDGTALDDARYL